MALQEGLWDCRGCGIANRGREIRCQGCGEPRGEDVAFYLPEDAADLAEGDPLLLRARSGPDWICGYCDASNTSSATECSGCGAPSQDGKHRRVQEVLPDPSPIAGKGAAPPPTPPTPPTSSGFLGKLFRIAGFGLLALLVLGIWGSRTTERTGKIVASHWERSIKIEAYRTLSKEGWRADVPGDARVVSSERRQKGTRDVLVGTETRYRDVSKKVADGQERYKCGKIDKGNGFFEDKYCERTRYRTVTSREPYTHNIYRKDPVYDDWLSYQVDRWVEAEPERLEGTDHRPRWPEPRLDAKRREAGRSEGYRLEVELTPDRLEWKPDEAFFLSAPPGTGVIGTVNNFGQLTALRLATAAAP